MENEMEMEREKLARLHSEVKRAYKKLSVIRPIFEKAQKDYLEALKRFQEADYELALNDGRLKKVNLVHVRVHHQSLPWNR